MKGFFRFASVMAVLTGLLSVSSLAETSPYDAARVLRVTMKDGSTRLFLAEHVDSITFKADLKDSSGIGSPDKFKEANLKLVDFVEYNHLQAVFDGAQGVGGVAVLAGASVQDQDVHDGSPFYGVQWKETT